jgi:hypothetical protein
MSAWNGFSRLLGVSGLGYLSSVLLDLSHSPSARSKISVGLEEETVSVSPYTSCGIIIVKLGGLVMEVEICCGTG